MPEIKPGRLMADLHRLRSMGSLGTGVVRPAFSPADMAARRWLCSRMEDAGLQACIDGVGNVLGRSQNRGRTLLLGSHTDTQPQGGWLDGALGVICGLEVARAFSEDARTAHSSIDVASWSDEEGTYMGMLGSHSFCGMLQPGDLERGLNHLTGVRLPAAIKEAGLEGVPLLRLDEKRYAAYLEAHIEQGPYLEAQELLLGVVTSIVGIRSFKLTFAGQQNHAGTTPMRQRRDAGAALVRLAHRLDLEFSKMAGSSTVWTIGHIELKPGSSSVVPGKAEMLLEIRDPDETVLDLLEARITQLSAQASAPGGVEVRCEALLPHGKAVRLDERVQQCLEDAAELYAPGRWIRMVSGAAHDAQIIANGLPGGMLFVPSIGGISHDFSEDSKEQDIIRGCRTLAAAAEGLFRLMRSDQV